MRCRVILGKPKKIGSAIFAVSNGSREPVWVLALAGTLRCSSCSKALVGASDHASNISGGAHHADKGTQRSLQRYFRGKSNRGWSHISRSIKKWLTHIMRVHDGRKSWRGRRLGYSRRPCGIVLSIVQLLHKDTLFVRWDGVATSLMWSLKKLIVWQWW